MNFPVFDPQYIQDRASSFSSEPKLVRAAESSHAQSACPQKMAVAPNKSASLPIAAEVIIGELRPLAW
jgi:hypothetical protein